jgi:hypothetical protein
MLPCDAALSTGSSRRSAKTVPAEAMTPSPGRLIRVLPATARVQARSGFGMRADAGKRRLVVAIAAERDRVRDPVVHRVAVDMVELERHVRAAAVGTAAPVDRKHPRPELHDLADTGAARSVGGAVRAVRQHAASETGTRSVRGRRSHSCRSNSISSTWRSARLGLGVSASSASATARSPARD